MESAKPEIQIVSFTKRTRVGSEQKPRDVLAVINAAKRKSMGNSNHTRPYNFRQSVMERIMGNRASVFGSLLANEGQNRRVV